MSECSLINKNSKLYQKFLQKKGKRDPGCINSQGEFDDTLKTRSQSNYIRSSKETSTEQSPNEVIGEYIRRQGLQISKFKLEQDQNLDILLKQELQRSRNKSMFQYESKQKTRQISNKNPSFQSQKDLNIQNQSLKQTNARLTQQICLLQQQINQQIAVQQRLQQTLYQTQNQLKAAISQINELKAKHEKSYKQQDGLKMIQQIEKLKEQNYLAKDYLYKLTLKLYQSQQENQVMRLQLDCRKQSKKSQLELNTAKGIRHRQFSNHRQNDLGSYKQRFTIVNSQPINPKPKEIRIAQIKKQLEQLDALKVLNGKSRRRKIQLQRELEQFSIL